LGVTTTLLAEVVRSGFGSGILPDGLAGITGGASLVGTLPGGVGRGLEGSVGSSGLGFGFSSFGESSSSKDGLFVEGGGVGFAFGLCSSVVGEVSDSSFFFLSSSSFNLFFFSYESYSSLSSLSSSSKVGRPVVGGGFGFGSGLASGFDSALGSGFETGLASGFETGLASGFETGLASGFETGLGSVFGVSFPVFFN